jgi:DNA-binding HxlR family transcriptional regulator
VSVPLSHREGKQQRLSSGRVLEVRKLGCIEYDVFLADCPARTTLSLVADTWSVVVIHALGERPRRYSELQERIGGISKKMLTQTVRKLERNGLVQRRRIRSAPPGVEYRLTELGETLLEPVRSLSRWAEEHTDAMLAAQAT